VTSVAHAWSLADEEQFYLVWPMIFLVLASRAARPARRILIGIIIAVVVWRSYPYLIREVGAAYVYNAFDTRCDTLAIGCLLAFPAGEQGLTQWLGAIATKAWMPLVTAVVLYISRVLAPANYHYSVGFTVDAILMALLIVQLMQLTSRSAWSWLNHPVTRFFGAISYPRYLYHGWGMSIATHLGHHGVGITTVLAIAASTCLACGSYYCVERPFLRLKRRFEGRQSHPNALLGATQP
jgi:peptidoglycan/LPS O-acetylase OafA/YrhL